MYVPTTLNQPAAALLPVGIATSAPLAGSLAGTAISVRGTRLNVLDGHEATVTGTLRPGLPGRLVTLQALSRHGWSTVARTRTHAQGRFELRLLSRRTGSERVRVNFAGDVLDAGAHRRLGWLNTYRLAG